MKTRDGLAILMRRLKTKPGLQEAYEEATLNRKIGDMIYNAREEVGLSQVQLAKLIGTQQSVISRLEDADYEGHSLSMLQRIAKALGKTLILGFQDKKKKRAA
jgi:ribosome-binding protein aMBF1 (putative translation factor)